MQSTELEKAKGCIKMRVERTAEFAEHCLLCCPISFEVLEEQPPRQVRCQCSLPSEAALATIDFFVITGWIFTYTANIALAANF